MLSSILGMEELTVEDIMTPHAEIIGINITESLEAAQQIIKSSYYSRLPVFKGTIDSVIGVLHLKDSHQFIEALKEETNLKDLLSETTFISQSTTISTQLNKFQQQDNNLSLVVDESLVSADTLAKVRERESEIMAGMFRVNVNDARPVSDK